MRPRRQPGPAGPVVPMMHARLASHGPLILLLAASLGAQEPGYGDLNGGGFSRTRVAAPSGRDYRGNATGTSDVFGMGTGSVGYTERTYPTYEAPVVVSSPGTIPVPDRFAPGGGSTDTSFLAAELRAQQEALGDLEFQIRYAQARLQQNPSDTYARTTLDQLVRAHQQTQASIAALEQRIRQVGTGTGTGTATTPGGIGYGDGPGSAVQPTGNAAVPLTWVRSETVVQTLQEIRQDAARNPDILAGTLPDHTSAEVEPTGLLKHKAMVVIVDSIMDIRDQDLRGRVHRALILSLGEPGHDVQFARLLAVVSQMGPDTATAETAGVKEALYAFFQPVQARGDDIIYPQETIAEYLAGRVRNFETFGEPVSLDMYRQLVSHVMDGTLDPSGVPPAAQAAWKRAVRSTLVLQQALAYQQLHHRGADSTTRLVHAWNGHVRALKEYIRLYGPASRQAPLVSRGTAGFLLQGQTPQQAAANRPTQPGVEPPPPGGVTPPIPGTQPLPPATGAPADPEVMGLLQRLREHRARMTLRLRALADVLEGSDFQDYSDWREVFSFWEWGGGPDSPAEQRVEELRKYHLSRTENLGDRRSLVGLIDELAAIEAEVVRRGWVFPTSARFRRPEWSDAQWAQYVSTLSPRERSLLMVGNTLTKARTDAFVALALAYRFEQGDFDDLDESATGGNAQLSQRELLARLFIKSAADGNPEFDGLAAAAFLRGQVDTKVPPAGGTWPYDRADLLQSLAPAVRYFSSEGEPARGQARDAMNEVRLAWSAKRRVPRAIHLGRLELERTRQRSEPLAAYRAILIQEATR